MPQESNGSNQDWQTGVRKSGRLIGLGAQMGFTMALFTVGGVLLDRRFETSPILTLVGAVLGMTSIFVYLFRVVSQLNREERRRRDND